jgi:hypothetical protein
MGNTVQHIVDGTGSRLERFWHAVQRLLAGQSTLSATRSPVLARR